MTTEIKTITPAMFTIPSAVAYTGFARSRLYLEIKAGNLDCRKAGRRTLISRASLDAMLDALPRAANSRQMGTHHGR